MFLTSELALFLCLLPLEFFLWVFDANCIGDHRLYREHESLKHGLQDCSFLSSLNLKGNAFTSKAEKSGFPGTLDSSV
ncbi:hypothetical protein DFJ73DRAFT_27436 [Zopfochytrium polystomum]|nr:hypothetical protein DFJ73DRAFT_27436 [Zopfochytrium polystomum]